MIQIRHATASDAEAIRDIYNHAVENTLAIWNDVIVDGQNRIDWMKARTDLGFPVLVAEDGGRVVGYASFGTWRAFDGYKHTVEHSVYVAPDAQGRGVGRTLMVELIEQARALGIHVMLGGIEAGNAASIKLHQSLGFVQTALMPQVGTKRGQWLDLAFLQLTLDQDVPNGGLRR